MVWQWGVDGMVHIEKQLWRRVCAEGGDVRRPKIVNLSLQCVSAAEMGL